MFEHALSRAKYLDYHLARTGEPVGPLHGIPISIKDTFRITGVDSSIGIAALCSKPSATTSPLVSLLISAGAVIHCKTNVPQTLMALDSDNNIFGRVLNPLNRHLTAGGSSGGEGALLGMKAAAMGVGTDIGGSIRIPAACNGLYGAKPSQDRVPFSGQQMGSLPGTSALGISARAGPIARSPRDCELFFKTVASARPWERDPNLVPGFWDSMDLSARSLIFGGQKKPLTFGILSTDNLMTPLPPIQASLRETTAHLTHAGHKAIPLPCPPSFAGCQSLANAIFSLDGGQNMRALLAEHSEPLTSWLAPRIKFKDPKTLERARDFHAQRERLRREMLEALWKVPGSGEEIDAIVCPVAPHPTPEIDTWGGVNYTSGWVLLDYCAGVVPVREIERGDLEGEIDEGARLLGRFDEYNKGLWRREVREQYLGSVLSVQVVAPKLQEKRLLRAMKAVDGAVKGLRWDGGEEAIDEQVASSTMGMMGAKL